MKPLTAILHEWTEVFMRRSMRDFKRFMDEHGLSPSQVNALMRLHYGGASGVSEIAEHTSISNAAASQMVDRLFQMGLIERTESPDDRRAKHLTLTAAGRSLVEQGIDARRCWMEELVSSFTYDQQAQIGEALMLLTQAARELEREQDVGRKADN
jgi:DNA-binding MarR family transcriptional regulator